MKFEWELISKKQGEKHLTYRAKVIGGWVFMHLIKGVSPLSNLIFISDSEHVWEVEEE